VCQFSIGNLYQFTSGGDIGDLKKLNSIRNAVMHPVKGKSWDQDDFAFVGKLLTELSNYATKTGKPSALIQRTVVFGAYR
jgi:hypothetical protein